VFRPLDFGVSHLIFSRFQKFDSTVPFIFFLGIQKSYWIFSTANVRVGRTICRRAPIRDKYGSRTIKGYKLYKYKYLYKYTCTMIRSCPQMLLYIFLSGRLAIFPSEQNTMHVLTEYCRREQHDTSCVFKRSCLVPRLSLYQVSHTILYNSFSSFTVLAVEESAQNTVYDFQRTNFSIVSSFLFKLK
jgi:hypothetical protein